MPITTIEGSAPAVVLPETGVNPVHNVAAVVAQANVQAAQAAAAAPVVVAPVAAEQAAPAVATPAAVAVVPGELNPGVSAVDAGGATPTDAAPTTQATGEPVIELTPSQKLAAKIEAKKAQQVKLADEIAKLEQQFRAADLLDSVKESSVIVARVGRAETSREVQAVVIGVQTLPNGDRRLKIYFGEGFDAETVVIQDSQIVDVKQA